MATGYRPPGFRISFKQAPTSAAIIPGPRAVVLIGPAATTLSPKGVTFTRGTTPNGQDMISSSLAVTSIDKITSFDGSTTYVSGTDYILTIVGSDSYVDWSPAGAEPASGEQYLVSYTYNKRDVIDYQPLVITNSAEAIAMYGQATSDGITVTNPLTLAITNALASGISEVYGLQLDPSVGGTDTLQYTDAATKLEEIDNAYYLVPLSTSSDAHSAIKAHVAKMSTPDESRYRVAYLVPDASTTPDGYVSLASATAATKLPDNTSLGERIQWIAPSTYVQSITATDLVSAVDTVVPGYFAAATLAGAAAAGGISVTQTDTIVQAAKELRYTNSSTLKYTRREMNKIAGAGVTVLVEDPFASIVTVRDSRTSDPSTPISSDPAAITIKDQVAFTVARSLLAKYKNAQNTSATLSSMTIDLDKILSSFISASTPALLGFSKNTVIRDPNDPRRVIVSYKINPVQSIREIDVSYGIDLSLGS